MSIKLQEIKGDDRLLKFYSELLIKMGKELLHYSMTDKMGLMELHSGFVIQVIASFCELNKRIANVPYINTIGLLLSAAERQIGAYSHD